MLAAPDRYTPMQASDEAVEKLLAVARQDFDYVVVDAGSRLGTDCKTLSLERPSSLTWSRRSASPNCVIQTA